MESQSEFPKMPEVGGRGHALEASGSMVWTLLFLAYSSKTVVSEFGTGWPAAWTILLVVLPVTLTGMPAILDRRSRSTRTLLTYLLYVALPSLIQLGKSTQCVSLSCTIADLVTVLVIWLPLEFKMLSNDLSPTGKVTVWGLLTAALNIANVFTVLRPLSDTPHGLGLGYTFKMNPRDLLIAVLMASIFCAIAIPLSILTKFSRYKAPSGLKPGREIAAFIGIYMSALTEELLFRGLMQNMLERRLGRTSLLALFISAFCYGAAHIRKSKHGFEPPNYRFALVAIVGGVTTGLVWRWTAKVTASAITHAVSHHVLWRLVLTAPSNL